MELQEGHPVHVHFAPTFGNKRLKVMEMSQPLLDTVVKEGSVKIKGGQDEEAVLCTNSKTFQIRFLEYSNTQLLLDPDPANKDSASVIDQTDGYYELKEMRPRILRIGELLSTNVYKGSESASGMLFSELEGRVQASTEEIKFELERLGAVEMEGRWYLLDASYKADMTDTILDLIVEHDWPTDAVPCAECAKAVHAVDENFTAVAAEQCLKDVSTITDEKTETRALDEIKVCRFRARQLLNKALSEGGGSISASLEEFIDTWKEKVLPGMEPKAEMLRGIALMDVAGPRTNLRMFSSSELPHDPETRFRKLFSMRPKWTKEDLQPYLSGMIEPGETEDKLLLKFTRVIQPVLGNPRLYSSR